MGCKWKICAQCGNRKRIGMSKSRCKQCRSIGKPTHKNGVIRNIDEEFLEMFKVKCFERECEVAK